MILYATITGTRANMAAMAAHGFRLIVGPDQLGRVTRALPLPLPHALDNGAWGAFAGARPWDAGAYREALARWGAGADWLVVPDVVGDSVATLVQADKWLGELLPVAPCLLAVQDGMTTADAGRVLGAGAAGVFVGGSTAWKWASLPMWATYARERGAYLHVGRVNSQRRIRWCADLGAHSTDGTSASRFSINTPGLAAAATDQPQPTLFWS